MKTTIGPLVAGLLAVLSAPASSECPQNYVFQGWEGPFEFSSAPAYGWSEGPSWSYGQPCQGACYDLRQGYLYGSGWNGIIWTPPGSATVEVADTYTIEGMTAGSLASFTAELHIVTTISTDPSRLIATVRDPETGDAQSVDVMAVAKTETRILALPLQKTVGSAFRLEFELTIWGQSEGEGWCAAEGRIRFRGLPAGAVIASCQSYDVPVPARTTSWGGLKSTYR